MALIDTHWVTSTPLYAQMVRYSYVGQFHPRCRYQSSGDEVVGPIASQKVKRKKIFTLLKNWALDLQPAATSPTSRYSYAWLHNELAG
jgi:hypothetical protein